ncbi:MAG: hypothetical protein HKN68_13310 [Saprospiraceae bacterium]|nr:hypothetical protein [Saprospiraceae bacterium]
MKNFCLLLTILTTMFSSAGLTQDINSIFNGKLTLDANLSKQTKAIDGLMSAYGEVETTIYSYEGTFEDAVNNMKAPQNSDVSMVSNQPLGNNFNMYIMMTENLNSKPMKGAWYDKAWEKVEELESIMGKSLSITINPSGVQNSKDISVGEKLEIRMINLSNPYVDLDNLKIIEGTWVSEMVATTIVTVEMLEGGSEDYEDEWDDEEMEMDIDLPEGAHFVGFDDVADSEFLQGDVNYVVEMSTDQAMKFFRENKERFVNSFEQSESPFQDGTIMTTFYLLTHDGDIKTGDDVISMTILPSPKSILSDALGKNQGTWTLISISRWIEEEY